MRLIDANALIREECGSCDGHCNTFDGEECLKCTSHNKCQLREAIDDAPTVYAEPVRHGEWIPIEMEMRFGTLKGVKCSLCGKEKVREGSNYCPNCGAKMDGKDTNVPTKQWTEGNRMTTELISKDEVVNAQTELISKVEAIKAIEDYAYSKMTIEGARAAFSCLLIVRNLPAYGEE